MSPAGIYIHIPFCVNKCPYCDFYSTTHLSLIPEFIDALIREMKLTRSVDIEFDTLYIGGGTPSVLDVGSINRVIEAACRAYRIVADAEVTLEVNPGTVTLDQLRGYRFAGINRVSIGVQSFNPANLDFLGRIHSSDDGIWALEWVREAGFDNVGLDLMYGIPGQEDKSWLFDLQHAVEFTPEHISCYMLTYESGTPMSKDSHKGLFRPLSDSRLSGLFETTLSFLNEQNYVQYEISNFARSGTGGSGSWLSRHNRKYWSGVPYIGLGPSAHSFDGKNRCWNRYNVKEYIKRLKAGRLPVAEKEELTREQLLIETIYLGLRQTKGIFVDGFNKQFDVDFMSRFGEIVAGLEEKGYVEFSQNRLKLTPKGMLFLDSITSMFI